MHIVHNRRAPINPDGSGLLSGAWGFCRANRSRLPRRPCSTTPRRVHPPGPAYPPASRPAGRPLLHLLRLDERIMLRSCETAAPEPDRLPPGAHRLSVCSRPRFPSFPTYLLPGCNRFQVSAWTRRRAKLAALPSHQIIYLCLFLLSLRLERIPGAVQRPCCCCSWAPGRLVAARRSIG